MKFISIFLTLILFIPAVVISYLYQAFFVGWTYGEWLFDPKSFEDKYSSKISTNEIDIP